MIVAVQANPILLKQCQGPAYTHLYFPYALLLSMYLLQAASIKALCPFPSLWLHLLSCLLLPFPDFLGNASTWKLCLISFHMSLGEAGIPLSLCFWSSFLFLECCTCGKYLSLSRPYWIALVHRDHFHIWAPRVKHRSDTQDVQWTCVEWMKFTNMQSFYMSGLLLNLSSNCLLYGFAVIFLKFFFSSKVNHTVFLFPWLCLFTFW